MSDLGEVSLALGIKITRGQVSQTISTEPVPCWDASACEAATQ